MFLHYYFYHLLVNKRVSVDAGMLLLGVIFKLKNNIKRKRKMNITVTIMQ